MKRYLPYSIAAGATLLVLIIIYVTAPAAQTGKDRLDSEIMRKVAAAQSLFDQYKPGEQYLLAATDRLIGKDGQIEFNSDRLNSLSGKWSDVVGKMSESPLKPMDVDAEQQMSRAEQESRKQGGAEVPAAEPAGDASGTFSQVQSWFQKNEKRLKEAAQLVDEALRSSTEGAEAYSGRDNIEANRLRAVLAYHLAEAARRDAVLQRNQIDRLNQKLVELHGKWAVVTNELTIAETMLSGGELVAAPPATPVEPAAPETKSRTVAPKKATQGKGEKSKLWIFSGLTQAKTPPPAAPTEEPPKTEEKAEASAPAQEPAPAPKHDVPAGPLTPMAQRIAASEQENAAARQRSEKLEQQVQALRAEIAECEKQIAAKRAEAAAADKKMVDMEKAGFDKTQAAQLNKQSEEYAAAAKINREASRVADLLEHGGYPNAKLVSPDEEWHKAAVEPAAEQQPLQVSRNLRQLKSELASAENSLAGEKTLIAMLDARAAALKARQGDLQAGIEGHKDAATSQPALPGLKAQHAAFKTSIKEVAAAVRAAAEKADADTEEAVKEIDRGIQCIQQVKQLIGRRQSDARNAQPADGVPNDRLTMIQNEQWRVGDADAILADLHLLKGWLLQQQSLARHRLAQVYGLMQTMGEAGDAAAQIQAAEENVKTAIEEAKAATDSYEKAQQPFKNDWTLHVNAAAAYYLQAQLTRGQPSEDFRKKAMQEYQLATLGQETNPERRPYVARLHALVKAAQPEAAK